ncbi:hypothetical protein ACJRO7_024850 [Eucalyptus globulus]|uniref:Uncharacterized protein n=1 Tax=Eucalyptus globulus TaxID=34317 RepID=A0ABD3KAV8_EUCGL
MAATSFEVGSGFEASDRHGHSSSKLGPSGFFINSHIVGSCNKAPGGPGGSRQQQTSSGGALAEQLRG